MKSKWRKIGLAILLALGAPAPALGAEAPAAAQSDDPFAALVGKRVKRAERQDGQAVVERYLLASDDRAFVLEEKLNSARVQFLCGAGDVRLDCTLDEQVPAPEIYQLSAIRGPRGDRIYKDARGQTMLRIASYGGATVYWPGETKGAGASKSFGDDGPLVLAPASYEDAARRAARATALISAATGAPILFDIGAPPRSSPPLAFAAAVSEDEMDSAAAEEDLSEESFAVLADAVIRAAKGLQKIASDNTGARVLGEKINRVTFVAAPARAIALDKKTLRISYVPDGDVAGRPSSHAISRFLEESL